MQIIEFDIALFHEKVFVCISSSTDTLKEFFSEIDLSDSDNRLDGLAFNDTHTDGKYRRVIWLKSWDPITFVHEAYHVTKYIVDYHGVECHETGAYLIEFIYSQTLSRLNREIN
jgi:hypothetical protein